MIQDELDELYEMRQTLLQMQQEKADSIAALIPKEIAEKIRVQTAKFDENISTYQEDIRKLETDIQDATKSVGGTVSGSYLQAVYNSGRSSWDTTALKGYAVAHPEVLTFYKLGEPYVTIRAKK